MNMSTSKKPITIVKSRDHGKHFLAWISHYFYQMNVFWFSATSKTTSMGLGSQKGFVANPVHAPPHTLF